MIHVRSLIFNIFLVGVLAAQSIPSKAPDFSSDAVWVDTKSDTKVPHSIKGYRGQVLLIDFWEFTCINCIRDFTVLKRWYSKYHPYGFEIVGVHYGEFAMGFKLENVREAAKRFQLPWPIVADLHGSIWNAYHSDVWPNRYLVDPEGEIVMHLEGEGNDRKMEGKIQELLLPNHPEVRNIALDPSENAFSPQCGFPTQETYVGNRYGRGAVDNGQYFRDGIVTNFHAEKPPEDGKVTLSGKWLMEQDGVTSAGKEDKAELRYHARSLYAVLSVDNPKKPVRLNLLQDGKPVGRNEAGVDVEFDQQGSFVNVSQPRMYYLLKNSEFSSHLLALEPQGNGVDLHSFTYGNNCQQNSDPVTAAR
jgi:alkyl hydroperoxide reductase subunit AhpC